MSPGRDMSPLSPHSPLRPFFLLLLIVSLFGIGGRCYGQAAPHHRPNLPDRYTLRRGALPLSARDGEPQEYFDPTLPPVLPMENPVCSLQLLQHDFAYTYGSPPASGNFTPPENCQWNRAVLEFSAACAGEQYDRISAVWIDGVEVLRTSTAEPTEAGVFWSVRKDVTRYASLLIPLEHRHASGGGGRSYHDSKPKLRHVWVMLENIVNELFTGVYHVNLSLHFYDDGGHPGPRVRELGESRFHRGGGAPIPKPPLIERFGAKFPANLWRGDDARRKYYRGVSNEEKYNLLLGKPADLVIPVSNAKGSIEGFWFRIQKDAEVRTAGVHIPKNAYRAILEIYVSSHGDDEFWYCNPPNSYIEQSHLPTKRGNGAFREVYATIDGLYAGSVMAFPVVFTGGFNPLFWAPVVAIGAFDLPSYSLDVTPFMGALLKGDSHRISLGVSHGIPFWLLDANLHLWLDPHSSSVSSGLIKHQSPPTSISHSNKSHYLDGLFKLEAQRGATFAGWVRSSVGNLTYSLEQHLKYRSTISFEHNGKTKNVYSKSKHSTDLKIEEGPNYVMLARLYHKAKYPVRIITTEEPGQDDTYVKRTNLSHVMYEKAAVTVDKTASLSSIANVQSAQGWMEVKDHSVLSGSASTQQMYKYIDNGACYIRKVSVEDGSVLSDQSSADCRFQ